MKKIFIDPGHGGVDPGATALSLEEKDINLQIALLLKDRLNEKYTGHLIKLSRKTDKTLSLPQRTKMANDWGARVLLSIHVNAGWGTGFESYTFAGNYRNKQATNRLRKVIHQEIIKETGMKDRGLKEANFHMLRESAMAAVLTENGFIDHPNDAKQLGMAHFLNEIAIGHARGLAYALGLKEKGNRQNKDSLFHRIKRGDTLWGLARKHQTTVYELEKLNSGIDPYKLQIGSKIKIK